MQRAHGSHAATGGVEGGGAKGVAAELVPTLDLRAMRDPSQRPESYADEFAREMEVAEANGAAPFDERSREVDAMLYGSDPAFQKVAGKQEKAVAAASVGASG
jgi:hypothetical protein